MLYSLVTFCWKKNVVLINALSNIGPPLLVCSALNDDTPLSQPASHNHQKVARPEFISDLSAVLLFGADKALEGHSIVCEQCCAPPLLCLLSTTARYCLNLHHITTKKSLDLDF